MKAPWERHINFGAFIIYYPTKKPTRPMIRYDKSPKKYRIRWNADLVDLEFDTLEEAIEAVELAVMAGLEKYPEV